MSTKFQEYSDEPISSEFQELFATEAFSDVIEKWFMGASKSVVGIIENASNASIDESQPGTLNKIDDQFAMIESLLFQAIWNKQDSLRSSLQNASFSEMDFISPTKGHHEKLCIFDWIHEYSEERFPKVIDLEMIHLMFDIIGVSTYCRCEFKLSEDAKNDFDINERLMNQTLSYSEKYLFKEKNYDRWTRVMSYYRSNNGIDLW